MFCIQVGNTVEVKCNDKAEFVEAVIQKIQDCSQYTVGMYFSTFFLFVYVFI